MTENNETGAVAKAENIPVIPHGPWPGVTKERTAEIREWIAQLTDVDAPGYGYSPTLDGSVFAPLPESGEVGAALLADHGLKPSQALLHLVEAGPDAIALLLEKLDDAAPTNYTVENRGRAPAGVLLFR